jgi:plastocyanin
MTTRNQIKRQHQQQRDAERRSRQRGQHRRAFIKIGVVAAAAVSITALAVIVQPWSSSSSEAQANLPALALTVGDNYFRPEPLRIQAGQAYRLNVTNEGRATHDVWMAGSDGKTDTADDIRTDPIPGGGLATEKIQFDNPGTYYFVCTFHGGQGGTLIVQ